MYKTKKNTHNPHHPQNAMMMVEYQMKHKQTQDPYETSDIKTSKP